MIEQKLAEKIISDYDNLCKELYEIACDVAVLRTQYGLGDGIPDKTASVEIEKNTVRFYWEITSCGIAVSCDIEFPLTYLWSPNYLQLETDRILAAKLEKEQQQVWAAQQAEQSERQLYEELKKKFEGNVNG